MTVMQMINEYAYCSACKKMHSKYDDDCIELKKNISREGYKACAESLTMACILHRNKNK